MDWSCYSRAERPRVSRSRLTPQSERWAAESQATIMQQVWFDYRYFAYFCRAGQKALGGLVYVLMHPVVGMRSATAALSLATSEPKP